MEKVSHLAKLGLFDKKGSEDFEKLPLAWIEWSGKTNK